MLIFNKLFPFNLKFLEIIVRGTHQYHPLGNLGSMHIVMSHRIGAEFEEIILNLLLTFRSITLFKVYNRIFIIIDTDNIGCAGV